MIFAKICPLSFASVWRQFQVIDYALSLPPLFSLTLWRYFQNAAGHNGFMSRPYFGKHRWWAAIPPPRQ